MAHASLSRNQPRSLLLNFHHLGLEWFLRSGRLVAEGGGRFWPMGSQGALWRHCPRSSLVETSLLQVGLWALPLHPPLRPRLALFIAPTTTYWFQHQRNGLKPDKTSNDIETKCRHLISDFTLPLLLLCPYYFHCHYLKGKLCDFFCRPKLFIGPKSRLTFNRKFSPKIHEVGKKSTDLLMESIAMNIFTAVDSISSSEDIIDGFTQKVGGQFSLV